MCSRVRGRNTWDGLMRAPFERAASQGLSLVASAKIASSIAWRICARLIVRTVLFTAIVASSKPNTYKSKGGRCWGLNAVEIRLLLSVKTPHSRAAKDTFLVGWDQKSNLRVPNYKIGLLLSMSRELQFSAENLSVCSGRLAFFNRTKHEKDEEKHDSL